MNKPVQKLLLLTAVLSAALVTQPAEAQRRGSRLGAAQPAYETGLRPFIGAYGDMDLDDYFRDPAVGGDKFVWGLDLVMGPGTGMAYVLGLHLGAGNGDFVMQPLFELHYRFETGTPLVPWVGGGASMKLGFANDGQGTNLALTFRLVGGAEWWLSPTVALGMQLALPDIGPRFLPSDPGVQPVGTIEWIFGPHVRF